MAVVDDFVFVRFATAPHSFMRKAHKHIVPWLQRNGIPFTDNCHPTTVYFELPGHLQRYTEATEDVCKEISPFVTEIKRRLATISWATSLKKHRKPFTEMELRNLAEIGLQMIL